MTDIREKTTADDPDIAEIVLGATQYGKAGTHAVRINRDTDRHEIRDVIVTSAPRRPRGGALRGGQRPLHPHRHPEEHGARRRAGHRPFGLVEATIQRKGAPTAEGALMGINGFC